MKPDGLRCTAAIWLLLAAAAPVAAQQLANAKIETIAVADGIYMLRNPQAGNIGVSIGADGVLIIDDQFAPMTKNITAAIAELSDEPVKMVLNTHWHGDHTGGNENLARAGAIIVAHDNVRVRMSASHFSEFFNSTTPPAPEQARPVITFDNTVTFHLNGETIVAQHVPPAHTDGDSIIWFRNANVVHMGDTFFNGLYPFIDVASQGSIFGMIGAINLALEQIDERTRVIPGHGPLSDRAGLIAFRDMLETVGNRIQKMINEGRSFEDIIAAKPTAEFDEQWGGGFIKPDQWVTLVYRDLAE